MATQYKTSTNTDPTKATYGTKGSDVFALQNAINATKVGTPISTDSMYGPQTQTAYTNLTNQGYTYNNGAFSKAPAAVVPPANTSTSNPVVAATDYGAIIKTLGEDLKKANSTLQNTSDANTKLITNRMNALNAQRAAEIAQIKTDYEASAKAQEERQGKDYAGSATNLMASTGGFNSTVTGALNNLKKTFEDEKGALMGKRDAAIRQAQNAYDEKDFQLASQLMKEAKDTETEIYNRQKETGQQTLQIIQEERAADTYQRGFADDKAKAYAMLSDADFAKLTPTQLKQVDDFYYPGYAEQFQKITAAANKGKTIENDLKYKNDVQTLINKTPQGQKITLADGTTYMGMKKPAGVSTSGLIAPVLANQLGMPSLAGKDESDVILSLSFDNAPQWYKDYYKNSNPNGWAKVKDKPDWINADWKIFKELPDISAYAKSSVVTSRIAGTNNFFAGVNAESIANALKAEE